MFYLVELSLFQLFLFFFVLTLNVQTSAFLTVDKAYFFDDGSALEMDYMPGGSILVSISSADMENLQTSYAKINFSARQATFIDFGSFSSEMKSFSNSSQFFLYHCIFRGYEYIQIRYSV